MLLQFLDQPVAGREARRQDDKRFDHLPSGLIGAGDHRRLGHRRVFPQGAFHLEGPDAVAGAENHVVAAADEPEVAVIIHVAAVAGQVPAVAEDRGGALRRLPVFLEKPHRACRFHPDRDVAFGIGGQQPAVAPDHPELDAGRRLAHGAEARRQAGKTGGQQHRFGLAVAVADGDAGGALPDLDDLRSQRFAGGHAVPQRGELAGAAVMEDQHAIDGRGAAQGGDGVALQEFQGLDRVEMFAVVDEQCRTAVPGAEIAAPGRLGPARVAHIPVQVCGPQIQPESAGDLVADGVGGVGVEGHLGGPGGA